jgi:hypothetical protein
LYFILFQHNGHPISVKLLSSTNQTNDDEPNTPDCLAYYWKLVGYAQLSDHVPTGAIYQPQLKLKGE